MKHHLKKEFIQDGLEFFQPGGHYFVWGDDVWRTRCYIFSPVQDVYSVKFVHYKHGGQVDTVDPGHAYAGWVRLEFYEGKQWQSQVVNGDFDYKAVDTFTGAKNFIIGGGGDLT